MQIIMTRRTEKVASLLHHEVGEYLLHFELPAITTISKVEVTPDLKWCKIWITILGDAGIQQEVLRLLKENLPKMQTAVNQNMTMKFVPKISFVVDHGEEYAAKINDLLKKTREDH